MSTLVLEVEEETSAQQLLETLSIDYPSLKPYVAFIRVAVNEEYVSDSTVLHDDDVVALITPVSGG